MSAQPCGCDPEWVDLCGGKGWLCLQHRADEWMGKPHNVSIVLGPIQPTGLPSTDAARKALPLWTGFVMYFPDVLAAVAEVSKKGNDQHNPGEPLHWAREKSTDQMNTAMRHMVDHARGNRFDTDGSRHLAKAIWRLCAELQLDIEKGTT